MASLSSSAADVDLRIRVPWLREILHVRVSLKDTVGSLKCKIPDQLEDAHVNYDLLWRYHVLDDSSTLESVGVQTNNLLYIKLRPSSGVMINIYDFCGTCCELNVHPEDKVSDVIRRYCERNYGRRSDDLVLYYQDCKLERSQNLADYNIQNGDIFTLIKICYGGGGPAFEFEFNSLGETVKKTFDSSAPFYRGVASGLSFRATCKTKNCEAYGQVVYVSKGFGTFDIGFESDNLQCPACHQETNQSTNCGFYNAKWDIVGKLVSGEKRQCSGIANTEEYYTFKEGENARWSYLRITVTELGR